MKVVLVSTFDTNGGAARATYRLHQGLCNANISSQLLVQLKQSDVNTVNGESAASATAQVKHGLKVLLNQLPVKFYPNRESSLFSPQWLPDNVASNVNVLNPDIVNLHWTSAGYLQVESITKFKQPVILTLHDMWTFTGGCHYTQNCDRYVTSCGSCPQLGSSKEFDLSRKVWQRKAKAWRNSNFTIVALSNWMANSVKNSPLLQNHRLEVIPNGLDTQKYRPFDTRTAREILGLPQEKNLLLTGSINSVSEKRKGTHLLIAALEDLNKTEWQNNLELVVFGSSGSDCTSNSKFKTHFLGTLNDDSSLALAYSAADIFVAPSLQDNLPNTVMESLACGTPCVAFDIGGMPDMIDHQQNGYLAKPYQIEDLVKGIIWILEDQERYKNLSTQARRKIEQEFSQELQTQRYRSLFYSILNQQGRT